MRSDAELLQDIIDCANEITEFIKDGEEYFHSDLKTQRAVLYDCEIIGEATKNLSKQLKEDNPQLPWKRMARMRDVLIHVYFVTDLNAVWTVASQQVGVWKIEGEAILRNLENNP